MTNYDYRKAIEKDVREYLQGIRDGEHPFPSDLEKLYNTLFTEDSVTGNASGSYWCNANKARECIMGDPNAEDYIREVISGYGMTAEEIADHFMDWEYWDVTIRCELLYNVLGDVIDDMEFDFEEV